MVQLNDLFRKAVSLFKTFFWILKEQNNQVPEEESYGLEASEFEEMIENNPIEQLWTFGTEETQQAAEEEPQMNLIFIFRWIRMNSVMKGMK